MSREPFPDLTTEILLRLPVKSLLRFRCLSNALCDEIDSSNFARLHLNRSINTRTRRKLIFTRSIFGARKKELDLYASDFDDGLRKALRIHHHFTVLENCTSEIVGTCHGLILLSVQENEYSGLNSGPKPDLFLWNPTTRQIKKLPPCPGGWPYSAGLGYDSATDDYKVVSIFTYQKLVEIDSLVSVKERRHTVWVFSLKSNSWRYTQHLDLGIGLHPNPTGYANGFLYWPYIENEGPYSVKIGCIDLAREVFFTLPRFYWPHDDGLSARMVEELAIYFRIKIIEGNVLMTKIHRESQVDEFYSSVVDKVRGGDNWSKAFTFEARSLPVSPMAYSKDGASVLLHVYKDIYWYNIEKKTRKRVKFLRGMSKSYSYDCYVVWESLVSLGNDGTFHV